MQHARYRRTEEEEEVANAESHQNGDESENDDEPEGVDGMADQFEAALAARGNNIWTSGGAQKDVAIRLLIQCFGSMIESHAKADAIPDFRGRIRAEDMEHRKLLDASKHVVKARQVLIKNENFDSRDFTIFIAQKKWVKNILRPLLELCAREDCALAMNCCSLALILVKKISDRTAKLIDKFNKKKSKKSKIVAIEGGSEENEGEGEGGTGKSTKAISTMQDSQSEDEASPNKINNAKEQVLALLSFKEALCSEMCNQAITNAFRECWVREQQATEEETKLGVARCISYFRRILSISPHKDWSTPSEILDQRVIHNRYIIQLRIFLSLLPGIISDVRRSYHDDWLTDIVLILFYIFDNFKAQELFLVWKSDALMKNFLLLAQETDETQNLLTSSEGSTQQEAVSALSEPVVAPEALKRRIVSQTLGIGQGTGSLKSKLLGERINREKQATAGAARFSRFTSTYQVPLYNAASLENLSSSVQASHQAVKKSNSKNNNAANSAVSVVAGGDQKNKKNVSSEMVAANEEADIAATGGAKVITSSSIILKDPFSGNQSDVLPQVREKRSKKNLTFGQENDFMESSKSQAKLTEDGQRACVVVASLAESLTADVCFKTFVRRINEDLRRDELRVSPDMEWQYFSIITKLMAYNRLKLEDEYRQVQMRRQETSLLAMDATNEPPYAESLHWEPNLINVIDSLDKMSFTRVTFAMESLLRKPQTYHLVHFPMQMYTEMLCYLRIMLESSNEGHHEIAIGALYRLFYTSTGQTDPLPKLLTAWKPGSFPKAHLFQLVEVMHQTLKTLEAARNIFVSQGITSEDMWKLKRKEQKKNGKKEIDMEMYLLSCLRFQVDDYFKRLVSNHTVSMYMRLLQRVDQNDAVVNHRVYVFLQRMCSFHLDNGQGVSGIGLVGHKYRESSQDYLAGEALQRAQSESSSNSPSTSHLGYLLFNVQCLQTIHSVLSDERLMHIDHLQPLIRLLRQIVRMFGTLANQNHLLFVEALFHHAHAHDHCIQIHSVYDAHSEAQRLLTQQQDATFLALSDEDGSLDEGDYDEVDDEADVRVEGESAEDREARRQRRKREKEEKRRLRDAKKAGLSGSLTTLMQPSEPNQLKNSDMTLSDTDESDLEASKAAETTKMVEEDDDDNEEWNDDIMEQRRLTALSLNNKGKKKRLLKKSKGREEIWDSSASSASEYEDAERSKARHRKSNNKNNTSKKSKSNANLSDDEEEAEAEDESDLDGDLRSVDSADTATKTKRLLQRESRATRKIWTKAEDRVLRQLYRRYQGMATVYVAIAMSDELRELGSQRNEQQIKHRVKYLRLDEIADDDDDLEGGEVEEEEAEEAPGARTASKASKKKKSPAASLRLQPTSPVASSTTIAQQEGITSVEKDDNDDIGADTAGMDWSAAQSRHKRPFDDYDFSVEDASKQGTSKRQKSSTGPSQSSEEQVPKKKKLLKKAKRSIESDDDDDEAPGAGFEASNHTWGEQTDTAPQLYDYQNIENGTSQEMSPDKPSSSKRDRAEMESPRDNSDNDATLDNDSNSPSKKRKSFSAVELARGSGHGIDANQPANTAQISPESVDKPRTINLKRMSLKHLLDSDEEDDDLLLPPPSSTKSKAIGTSLQ